MDRFEDHRGVIQDVLGRIDAVTRISTVAGAVRGNHYHEKTTQWTLVLSGRLLMASGDTVTEVGAGEVVKHPPGTPHAWRALEDTECLVFTLGPRSGEDYESDVIRLEEPLIPACDECGDRGSGMTLGGCPSCGRISPEASSQ